jgi:AraC-like DNA-binding protein
MRTAVFQKRDNGDTKPSCGHLSCRDRGFGTRGQPRQSVRCELIVVSWARTANRPRGGMVTLFGVYDDPDLDGEIAAENAHTLSIRRATLPNTLVHGVVERVFRTTINERGCVVGARFRPGGFTARFGRDDQPIGDELFGGAIHLEDDIATASARLDDLIGDYAGEPDSTYVALSRLVDRIRDDGQLHRVEQVMQQSPWSTRTTQRVFRRLVGVPVKWVLCRYRLQQPALEIERRPAVDHADLAVSLGWYDQAHFHQRLPRHVGHHAG